MPVELCVVLVAGPPGSRERLVEQILEVGAALLEAARADVRQVVGDDVDVELLGLEAGRSGVERSNHACSLPLAAAR